MIRTATYSDLYQILYGRLQQKPWQHDPLRSRRIDVWYFNWNFIRCCFPATPSSDRYPVCLLNALFFGMRAWAISTKSLVLFPMASSVNRLSLFNRVAEQMHLITSTRSRHYTEIATIVIRPVKWCFMKRMKFIIFRRVFRSLSAVCVSKCIKNQIAHGVYVCVSFVRVWYVVVWGKNCICNLNSKRPFEMQRASDQERKPEKKKEGKNAKNDFPFEIWT